METKNTNNSFSIKKRARSFRYAFRGIGTALKNEHNTWIHLTVTGIVIILGILFSLSPLKWGLIAFATGLVWTSELLNTAIEYLTDLVSPEYNETACKVKDVAAGAVLISAITAVVIGLLVFVPEILKI